MTTAHDGKNGGKEKKRRKRPYGLVQGFSDLSVG